MANFNTSTSLFELLSKKAKSKVQDSADATHPSFQIRVNGQNIENSVMVSGIAIYKALNKIPFAKLDLIENKTADKKLDKAIDAASSVLNKAGAGVAKTVIPQLKKGDQVSIYLGAETAVRPIFSGIIIKKTIQIRNGGESLLSLELKDETVKMTIERKNKLFTESTDSSIINDICSDYKLSGGLNTTSQGTVADNIMETRVTHPEMVQYMCTDWDFIIARAEANSQIVNVDNGKLSTIDIKSFDTGTEDILIDSTKPVYEFEAETDARDEYKNIAVSAWDVEAREVLKREAGMDNEKSIFGNHRLQHSGNINSNELNEWAVSRKWRSNLAGIKGRVRIDGNKSLMPGQKLKLTGFSSDFDNKISIISSVCHHFSGTSSFTTEIEFGYTQEWFTRRYNNINEMPASGLLSPVSGLQPGLVAAITGDPDNNYRIKVSLPMVENGSEGVWARLATLDAGKERGSFFMPEVGDEVVLGFMNDDPRQPVILGMLFSKNKNGLPPQEPEEENTIRGIYTKSKIKFEFDDERKGVFVKTPSGCEIFVSDEGGDKGESIISLSDQNDNRILMDKNGIKMSSAGEVSITAKKGITLKTQKDILNDASGQITLQGNAGAKLKSGANVEIKGTLVKIN